jgi:hypothetical protein
MSQNQETLQIFTADYIFGKLKMGHLKRLNSFD